MPDQCDQLRSILLEADPKRLERVAGFALGSLLGVPFRRARSGDQRGGDGGVSGIGGRCLVFEARRYGLQTRLDERSIRVKSFRLANATPDLEAWLLVTTQEVPEQIQDAMDETALGRGIGAISVDWLPCPLPKLAALAASCPDFFATSSVNNIGPFSSASPNCRDTLPRCNSSRENSRAGRSDTTLYAMPVTAASEKSGLRVEGRRPSFARMWPVATRMPDMCGVRA